MIVHNDGVPSDHPPGMMSRPFAGARIEPKVLENWSNADERTVSDGRE